MTVAASVCDAHRRRGLVAAERAGRGAGAGPPPRRASVAAASSGCAAARLSCDPFGGSLRRDPPGECLVGGLPLGEVTHDGRREEQ